MQNVQSTGDNMTNENIVPNIDTSTKKFFALFTIVLFMVLLVSGSFALYIAFSNDPISVGIKTTENYDASVDDTSDPNGKSFLAKLKAKEDGTNLKHHNPNEDPDDENAHAAYAMTHDNENESQDESGTANTQTASLPSSSVPPRSDYHVCGSKDREETDYYGRYQSGLGYYDTLDDNQKRYYKIIKDSVLNGEQCVSFKVANDVNSELSNVKAAIHCVELDYPEFSWWDGQEYMIKPNNETNSVELCFIYFDGTKRQYFDSKGNVNGLFTKTNLLEVKKQTEQFIFNIVSHMPSNLSTLNKLKWLNDYLPQKIAPADMSFSNAKKDINAYSNISVLGVIKSKKAVSEGYTKLFAACCKMKNIPCICVEGTKKNKDYMWNSYYDGSKWLMTDSFVKLESSDKSEQTINSRSLPPEFELCNRSKLCLENKN